MKNLILMDEYIFLGDTPLEFRNINNINFIIIFSHSANCTCILLSAHLIYYRQNKYLQTFDVICVDFLRCANNGCE